MASIMKGTIVRTLTRIRLTGIKLLFGVLDRFAPAWGARWASRIWCTLPAGRGRRRDERPRAGELSTITLLDGRRITVETWGFGPPVYLMHGWGGWRGQLGAFVTPLIEAGQRVVAVDAPGHGDSGPGVLGPGRATAMELADALNAAAGKHGKPVAVIAHSLGCTSTAIAVHDGLPAGRLVFIAPSADPVRNTRLLATAFGFGERTLTAMHKRLEAVSGRRMSDFDLIDLSSRTTMPPTLVVHDRDDKEVRYDEGAAVASSWPDAELASTEGLGHQRILRDPGVVATVVGYVTAEERRHG